MLHTPQCIQQDQEHSLMTVDGGDFEGVEGNLIYI